MPVSVASARFVLPSWMIALAVAVLFALPPGGPAHAQEETAAGSESETESHAEIAELDPFREAVLTVIAQRTGTAGRHLPVVYEYYSDPDSENLWVSEGAANGKARKLVEVLLTAYFDVLTPSDYDANTLGGLLDATLMPELAALEAGLSLALLDYTRHISAGRVEPHRINSELEIFPEAPDPMQVLRGVPAAEDIVVYATYTFEPQTPQYVRLRSALEAYRALAQVGGWPQVPGGETLKESMEAPERVTALRTRLEMSGDLLVGAHGGEVYDGALIEAVRTFQARHGLEVDGAIGPNTLTELNVTTAERVRQIELNMERRRWMKDDFGDFYVFVNLADQFLKVVELREDGREKTVHTALTVVGKDYHRTPVFSEMMTYLVVNPSWNVPRSIAVREFLPKLKRDPGALAAQNIRLLAGERDVDPYRIDWTSVSARNFTWRLQQRPGKGNALGEVKFMFPNKYAVYIHDTPSKGLFARAQRAFSHGCIRVQNPFDLAEVLLAHQGMSRAELDARRAGGVERVIRLRNPVPVHINYLTAWVNKDGTTHFRRDVYGRDAVLDEALKAATAG